MSLGEEKLDHQEERRARSTADAHTPSLYFTEESEGSSCPMAAQRSSPDRKPGPPEFQSPINRLSHFGGKGSWASSSKLQGDGLEMLPTLPLYSLPIPVLGDRMVGTMGQAEGSFSKDLSPLNPHPLPQYV